jgi:signal transduction histidine kinase
MTPARGTTPGKVTCQSVEVNIMAALRSDAAARLPVSARDGLALALVGPALPRPATSGWRERALTIVASLGVVIVVVSALTVPGADNEKPLGIGFLGLLLLAPRFRLAAWRIGILAALATNLINLNPKIAAVEFAVLLLLFCLAATVVERSAMWWMCVLTVTVAWLAPPLSFGKGAPVVTGFAVAAAVAMDAIRGWRRTREALAVETEHVEREQARRALLEERARIGRELHDVVAHHMSLIAVQAETAPYRLGGVGEPVANELAAISAAARSGLTEMRRLLGVLRNGEDAARAPQPRIEQISDLVDSARAAGIEVEYVTTGPMDTVPDTVGVCAYRIAQEALTNASRHAVGAAVRVETVRNADAVRLEVTNGRSADGSTGGAGPGHGLTGMRERATLLGGTLTAGPTADGGFAVTAVLPLRDG